MWFLCVLKYSSSFRTLIHVFFSYLASATVWENTVKTLFRILFMWSVLHGWEVFRFTGSSVAQREFASDWLEIKQHISEMLLHVKTGSCWWGELLMTDVRGMDLFSFQIYSLPGNIVDGTIGRQLVETLIESSHNVALIIRFFNMFLRLEDITSSEKFKEYDPDKRGIVSRKEFSRALEASKTYSRSGKWLHCKIVSVLIANFVANSRYPCWACVKNFKLIFPEV